MTEWKSFVRNVTKTKEFDVYVGRKNRRFKSEFDYKFGNPFPITKKMDRKAVCKAHKDWLLKNDALLREVRQNLKGKTLGCFCAPKQCHGDFLAEVANSDQYSYLDQLKPAKAVLKADSKASKKIVDPIMDL